MSPKIRITTHRSNSIVRRGETIEVEWTPRIRQLIDAGRLTPLSAPPPPGPEATKTQLVAEAEARGVHVAKSWSKDRIRVALTEGDDDA